jgi:hypothetical protein
VRETPASASPETVRFALKFVTEKGKPVQRETIVHKVWVSKAPGSYGYTAWNLTGSKTQAKTWATREGAERNLTKVSSKTYEFEVVEVTQS